VDGKLLLAGLKDRIPVNARWGGGNISSVDATLRNIVDVLRDLHSDVNIAMAPGLERVRINDLKLRTTALEQELDALRIASGNKFVWVGGNSPLTVDPMTGAPMSPGFSTIDPTTGLAVNPPPRPGTPLYILSESQNSPESRRRVEVFNLGDYFNALASDSDSREKRIENSLKEIQNIVMATIESIDRDHVNTVDFQFHSGANLMVVVGTPEALDITRQVVRALKKQVGIEEGGTLFGANTATFQSSPATFSRTPPSVYGVYGGTGDSSTSASSKEQREIKAKLRSIRLDSVLFDGAPLGEIVRSLDEAARKRDPEKKGVNFLLNPLAPQGAIQGQDVRAVVIKINPALTNVRLVDALDAVVRSAEQPIKYSITDYGVVFSFKGWEEPAGPNQFGTFGNQNP
jgi:hypothetical protein